MTERFISGELKNIFRVKFHKFLIGLTIDGKHALVAGGGAKRRYQYRTDVSGIIVYLRALQGHSGRNLIDLSLQDNVVIPSNFFQYIYHIGCGFNLHSIINSGLIPGGQNSSKRQTVFFLPVDPLDKSHKDPDDIDFNEPRRAQYLHIAWKRHQDAVYWVDINLAQKKGLKFYQTRSNAIILQETLPAYCVPKVVRLKTGEVLYEKAYMSRPPPKISLKHEWTRELGSKLIDSQKVKLFDSLEEKFNTKRSPKQHNRVSMLSRLMIDQGDLVKTQLQYKTTLKYIMRPKRSTLTMRQFVKELRQTWTSKFQDYHIPL